MNTESKPKLIRYNQDLAAVACADPLLLPVEQDLLLAECSRWDKLNERLVLEAAALIFHQPGWHSLDFRELTLHQTDAGWVLADPDDHQPVRTLREDWLRLQFLTSGQFLWTQRLREQNTAAALFDFARDLFGPPPTPAPPLGNPWLESEDGKPRWDQPDKVPIEGYDIGFERVLAEWVAKHRAQWRKARG